MKIKTEKIALYLILGLLISNIFIKGCTTPKSNAPKTIVVRDTIWKTKIDTFKIQTIKYEKVYVSKNNKTKIVRDTLFLKDPTQFIAAKVYRDTLQNEELEMYSYNLVKGELLDSSLSYKLKVPKEILITKTIEYPKTFRSGLYLFSEIGGNTKTFDNLSLGMQYNRKGEWFVSYRVNLNGLKPTHNIGVGWRLFN